MKPMHQTQHITTILFDMVGVLLMAKQGYIPQTQEEIHASHIVTLYNHVDDEKLLSDITSQLHLSDKEIANALPCIPHKYETFNPLWEILPTLKNTYTLGVINNGNALAHQYWLKKFDFSIFDIFINSALVKLKKPDPRIYLLACEKLHVTPEECLFMDDKEKNIAAAASLHMQTLWWNPQEYEKVFNIFKTEFLPRE